MIVQNTIFSATTRSVERVLHGHGELRSQQIPQQATIPFNRSSIGTKRSAFAIQISHWWMFVLVFCAAISVSSAIDVSVNGLSTTQGFTMISGGYSVSAAGDMNGDGVDDVIVGAPFHGNNNGVAYVVFGKKNTVISNVDLPSFVTGPNTGFRILPAGTGENFGWSVSYAGDVNDDGYDDVIIGSRVADISTTINAGISYVIFGRLVYPTFNDFADLTMPNSPMLANIGFRILGAAAYDESGSCVRAAGDVNGDGIDDVIIGAPEADPPSGASSAGIAYVVYGRSTAIGDVDLANVATGSDLGFRILGVSVNDHLGYFVSWAGDINKDGVSDIIVGAYQADIVPWVDLNTNEGISYVIFGRVVTSPMNRFNDITLTTSAMSTTVGFRILGAFLNDQSGYSVSRAGDINGDGIGDLLVGAINANSGAGASYVIFGRNVGGGATPFADISLSTIAVGTTVGFRIQGAAGSDNSGISVSNAGDVNADGVDDLIVGARSADPTVQLGNAGIAYVIYGRKSVGGAVVFNAVTLSSVQYDPTIGFRILGAVSSDSLGYSVSAAGDINGDGGNDVVVGTPFGSAYVIYGTPSVPSSQPSSQPSRQPSKQPSGQPTRQPTNQPSRQPTNQPSGQPTSQPSCQPSRQPSQQPSQQPTRQPSKQPSGQPTGQPTNQPSRQPTNQPSGQPTSQPSCQPSKQPSQQPSQQPTRQPSNQPSGKPSSQPSNQPTRQPSNQPSGKPTSQPSCQPSRQPSQQPSQQPTRQPSNQPSGKPSSQPSNQPSKQPSAQPSRQPSGQPTLQPSGQPTIQPSRQPSSQPSCQPSGRPSAQPSNQPSRQPTAQPNGRPTSQPSGQPSVQPSRQPTNQPSGHPSNQPSRQPSAQPSGQPSIQPTVQPSGNPSTQPSCQPSRQPSGQPSNQPSRQPSVQPSMQPTLQPVSQPSGQPSSQPSRQPSTQPSGQPTMQPTLQPSCQPSHQPSRQPSVQPSRQPSSQPSGHPSCQPTIQPSKQPSTQPTEQPSRQPSAQPSRQPSSQPSCQPTFQPSGQPSRQPTAQPSGQPSLQPSRQPSGQPSSQPSGHPSSQPSCQPSCQPSMQPSRQPSSQPTAQPTVQPSSQPSRQPSMQPSIQPTGQPSSQPSVQPSTQPSAQPTTQPTEQPSAQPSRQPTQEPTTQPSSRPSGLPSSQPSAQPSCLPTNQPSSQPSIQPSCCPTTQPSEQPSVQPTARPTTQPSTKPSAQPSHQPTSLPSTQPSVLPSNQPSIQPSGHPSSQPTVQPSSMPSGMPTSQPSSQPFAFPTSQPSLQPSVQPSAQPSMQPSSLPSAQPTVIPTDQPSSQPISFPSTQPTTQPSRLPSAQPSSTPSTQPSTQPTSRPSAQPSEKPLSVPTLQPTINPGMWVTSTDDVRANHVVMIQNDVWACGAKLARAACITIEAQKGHILANYHLPWENMVGVLQSYDSSRVVLSGRVVSELGSVTSDLASCSISTALDCIVKSFYDINATAVANAPYLKKVLLLGKQNVYNSIAIVDEATGSVASYLYSSQLLKTFTFSHALSPPNFVGTFVVGTAVSSSGFNIILVGMVRVDSGAISCLALSPRSSSILNSAELVNAMALEYVNPDSFIAGGLQLSDNAGMCAYLLRVNSLIGVLKYGMRYRARSGFNTTRRLTSDVIDYESFTRGVALMNTNIYMAVDLAGSNSTSLSVLKIDAETGSIIQQVHISSSNASLSCSDITASKDELFLYFVCTIDRSGFEERVVISSDISLSFWKIPAEFITSANNLFTAENVAFKTATIPVSVRKAQNYIADSEFSIVENTLTPNPSAHPSSAPSGQPSSSPTAPPSVSSQPTSQPSTSGPTITYRPTVKPTPRPSARPSRHPTRSPSVVPSFIPTVRPTVRPSQRPSPRPSVSPTTIPTRAPTQLPSRTPSRVVSFVPTAPIAESSTDGGKKKSSDEALVIGGSIFGGLLVLWCGKRMLKWIFHLQEQLEKKKALRELLMTSRSTIDPVQQRIVNETVQQRCAAVVASHQSKPALVAVAGPTVVSNNHSLDLVDADAPPPVSTNLWHQMDTDIENQPSTAPGLGRGAYINTWREETHTDAVVGDKVARKLSMVPSSGDFYDDDSSEVALSSLHSSEQSKVSAYTKQHAPDQNKDQHKEQDENLDQEQDQDETNASLLPSSLESSGEESISEYSDSSDSTNSSSSASYCTDDLSDASDAYSFPSSLTSGADNC